jgi:hypothetical protein
MRPPVEKADLEAIKVIGAVRMVFASGASVGNCSWLIFHYSSKSRFVALFASISTVG